MTQSPDASELWAWARDEADVAGTAHVPASQVTVVVVTHNGANWLGKALDSLAAQTVAPSQVLVVDAGSTDGTRSIVEQAQASGRVDHVVDGVAGASFGANVATGLALAPEAEWLWLLHDDVVAAPDALEQLVRGSLQQDAAVVGPLLIEPRRRRGRTVRIAEAGQTITADGVITGVITEGTIDQGQLEPAPVLGLNACGLLVRGEVFRALGGMDAHLPSSVQGLEFGWRARLAGHQVSTWPKARVAHVEASTRGVRDGAATDPFQERRRWGLTLNEAYRPQAMSRLEATRVRSAVSRRVLGSLVGKDFLDARLERRAAREWRKDRTAVDRLRAVYLSTAGADAAAVEPLRLTRANVRSRKVDEWFGRVVDWLAEFGDSSGGPGLEELTGDDFARDEQTRRGPSLTWVVAWVLVTAALVSARALFSFDALTGPQLAPVPDTFGALFGRFVDPVAGVWPSSGAPWVGLVWLASLLTLGHPDVLVSLLLLGAVPAAFLLARRVLGLVVADQRTAVVGASCYALTPILTGAVGSGQLGTVVWTLALPILGHLLVIWWEEYDASWQVIGGIGLTGVAMTAAEPVSWLPVTAAVVAMTVRAGAGAWVRAGIAVAAPAALLLTAFTAEIVRFPGRLLTGIEPLLAPQSAPTVLDIVLARSAPQAPPLWLSACVVGALWLLAIVGALFRRMAIWGLVAALGCAGLALLLTRLVVPVPPTGLLARPQASALLVGLIAALIFAAALGLDSVRAAVASSGFGLRHLVVYGGGMVAVAAVVLGSGWWVLAGTDGLHRTNESGIPTFIRKDAARGASRILTLDLAGQTGRWALLSDDLVRLGDGERGLTFGGDPTAAAVAASVAGRLASGAADERILPDLQRLGVGYLWVTGASGEQLTAVANVPGLGVGAVSDQGASWVVPGSGRLVLRAGGTDVMIDPDRVVPVGIDGRVLLLADPLGDPPRVSVGGAIAEPLPEVDGRLAFAVPASGGAVVIEERAAAPWWALAPALVLLLLALLAAPASNATEDARARAPRRVDGRHP